MNAAKGFSLLEVMVALSIASLALSWYLYCLSQVYYTKARARELLSLHDIACGEAFYFLRDFPRKIPSGATLKPFKKGLLLLRLETGKISWEILLSPQISSLEKSSSEKAFKKGKDSFQGKKPFK